MPIANNIKCRLMRLLAAVWSLKITVIWFGSWRNESVIHIVIFQTLQSKNKEYFMLLYWLIAAAAIIIIMTTFALLNETQFLAKTQLDLLGMYSTLPQWSNCLSGLNPGPLTNVCFKKTWTNYSTVSLLWFVQVFLKQTLQHTHLKITIYYIWCTET